MPTIDEAIELLKNNLECGLCEKGCALEAALKLAIEAFNFYKGERASNTSGIWMRLPGETEE